jgi:hypothetical protein
MSLSTATFECANLYLLTYKIRLELFLNFLNIILIAKSTPESQLQFFENKKTDLGQKTDRSFLQTPKWRFPLPVEIHSRAHTGTWKVTSGDRLQ